MLHVLLVALGGATGSVCRYLVGLLTLRWFGPAFPCGTLTVNVVGSLAIGLFAELVARRFNASAELRLLMITGFLGGFTTFSAFSLDFISLFERGATVAAVTYLAASVLLSICAVIGGLQIGRMLF
ncbi:fluoride efflux transporter CrcB [Ciceribacter sp. L1K22]|uniref:fluoride efflux transporter CrcB n=1 Tax=Ciceribacter sp. L1K22 TaxID=2820275 RepID=UPI001ABDDD2D|nr:fluoride efflux transporter CrcB [Ciceribacter sp. L1K22]MBO3760566.1 fluoride efflux transporter CrcB [Ciceribacter sp. L1K22]